MALANDSITTTPGTGATVATHLVGGKEHQVVMVANADGHIERTAETYLWTLTAAAAGASKLYGDIFNASGSGKKLVLKGVWAVPKLDVAVTGAVSIRIDLYRTSAVGTGGTAHAYKSATVDNAGGVISPMDTGNAALPAQVTSRAVPTGGATISEWLFPTHFAPEESNTSMGYMSQFFNLLPSLEFGQNLVLREGQGLLIKQGTVASVGSIGFLVCFTLE